LGFGLTAVMRLTFLCAFLSLSAFALQPTVRWHLYSNTASMLDDSKQAVVQVVSNSSKSATGIDGNALSLDGSSCAYTTYLSPRLAYGSETIAVWLLLSKSNAKGVIVNIGSGSSSNSLALELIQGKVTLTFSNGLLQLTASTVTSLQPNRWYLLSLVRAGRAVSVQLNNNRSSFLLPTHLAANDHLSVGCRRPFGYEGAYFERGVLAELMFWDRALIQSELSELSELYSARLLPVHSSVSTVDPITSTSTVTYTAPSADAYANGLANTRAKYFGRWQFQLANTAGIAFDQTGNEHHALVDNAIVVTADRLGRPQRVLFASSSQLTKVIVPMSAIDAEGGLSIAAWINLMPMLQSKHRTLMSLGGIQFGIEAGSRIPSVRDGNFSDIMTQVTTAVPIGRWSHLSFVIQGAGVDVFLDGTYLGAQTISLVLDHIVGDSISMGFEGEFGQPPKHFLDGLLDDVRVILRAVQVTELAEILSSASFPLATTCVWRKPRFAEPSGSSLVQLVRPQHAWLLHVCGELAFDDGMASQLSHGILDGIRFMPTLAPPAPNAMSAHFGGSSMMRLPVAPVLMATRTYSFWLQPEGTSAGSQTILAIESRTAQDRFEIRLINGNIQALVVSGLQQDQTPLLASGGISPGSWSHVAVAVEGRTHRVYVNGVRVQERVLSNLIPVVDTFTVGVRRFGQNNSGFVGLLINFRLYDTSLLDEDITMLASQREVFKLLPSTSTSTTTPLATTHANDFMTVLGPAAATVLRSFQCSGNSLANSDRKQASNAIFALLLVMTVALASGCYFAVQHDQLTQRSDPCTSPIRVASLAMLGVVIIYIILVPTMASGDHNLETRSFIEQEGNQAEVKVNRSGNVFLRATLEGQFEDTGCIGNISHLQCRRLLTILEFNSSLTAAMLDGASVYETAGAEDGCDREYSRHVPFAASCEKVCCDGCSGNSCNGCVDQA
jgi:hypothetical protein